MEDLSTVENLGTVEEVRSRRDLAWDRETVFHWKVEDFSSLPHEVDSPYYSRFRCCGRLWYLRLFPNGEEEAESEGYIGLHLFLDDWYPRIEVRYSLGIRTAKGETDVFHQGVSDDHEYWWGSETFIERSELLRRRRELLPRNVLTVTVVLKVWEESASAKGLEKIVEDIGKLWPDGEDTDALIKVRDVEFKVHRTILTARIPVLGAMFRHDTAEKASGEISIGDCEPDVFEQLLHYAYKGSPRQLTGENACPLYVVADKYLVSEVKEKCVQCMRDTLCVDTFCDTLTLCLIHREDTLLRTVTNFFSRNTVDVMKTVEWQKFMHEYTTWANEITIRATQLTQARYEKANRVVTSDSD